jgi:hypothetical protein
MGVRIYWVVGVSKLKVYVMQTTSPEKLALLYMDYLSTPFPCPTLVPSPIPHPT